MHLFASIHILVYTNGMYKWLHIAIYIYIYIYISKYAVCTQEVHARYIECTIAWEAGAHYTELTLL